MVIKCRKAAGKRAVLKISPDRERVAREIACLVHWSTPHVPTLLEADPSMRLYRLWHDLAESAVYVMQFRARHTADDNVLESWQNFQTFLPTTARWPQLK